MESATGGVLTLTLHRAISFALHPGAGPASAPAAAPQHLYLRSIKGKTHFSSSQLYIVKLTEDF